MKAFGQKPWTHACLAVKYGLYPLYSLSLFLRGLTLFECRSHISCLSRMCKDRHQLSWNIIPTYFPVRMFETWAKPQGQSQEWFYSKVLLVLCVERTRMHHGHAFSPCAGTVVGTGHNDFIYVAFRPYLCQSRGKTGIMRPVPTHSTAINSRNASEAS